MEPIEQKSHAKDFFLNLGATISLYTVVFSLINLLFTVINYAYPKVNDYYGYYGSNNISLPVSVLIIFFPIFIMLMWILGKDYFVNPSKRNTGIHKWLTFLTLFLAGGLVAGSLITTIYYFIDGQELTSGFLLKILVLVVVSGSVFGYYIADVRDKLTSRNRVWWRIFASILVLGSIILGFSVLGSPYTQRMYNYDSQKISDLTGIKSSVESYYSLNGSIPNSLNEMRGNQNYYYFTEIDSQTQKPYEYRKISDTKYELCAEFNKPTNEKETSRYSYAYPEQSWKHEAGRHCFEILINPNLYTKPNPVR